MTTGSVNIDLKYGNKEKIYDFWFISSEATL